MAGATGGVTRATAASRAKAATITDSKVDIPAGKRKREALGEVIAPSNKPAAATLKGKEKETFDGVVIKPKGVATRQPLRTVAGTRQAVTAAVKKGSKTEPEVVVIADENAMVVDPPVALPSIAVRKSNLIKESQSTSRRLSLRSANVLAPSRVEDDLEDDQPVHKKRRTSSVGPEDAVYPKETSHLTAEEAHNARLAAEMEAFANEVEADPENSPWDDLDADDDDPLMVNEYAQDIFKYLKQVEVILFCVQISFKRD